MEDFLGFSFNGVHSSEFNLYRVSKSNRYEEDLTPKFKDTTMEIPGNNGKLYWESFYQEKEFPIEVAFDNVDEIQYRRLSELFNGETEGELIFDERPYVAYYVKLKSPPKFKTLCFDEEIRTNNRVDSKAELYYDYLHSRYHRVYKGEGTLQFVCYEGLGHNPKGKYFLDDYDVSKYNSMNEWMHGSRLSWKQIKYNPFTTSIDQVNEFAYNAANYGELCTLEVNEETVLGFLLYNPGNKPMNWKIRADKIPNGGPYPDHHIDRISLYLKSDYGDFSKLIGQLILSNENRNKISNSLIDSKTHLYTELTNSSISPQPKKLLNEFIISGDFFTIPLGESFLVLETLNENGEYIPTFNKAYFNIPILSENDSRIRKEYALNAHTTLFDLSILELEYNYL